MLHKQFMTFLLIISVLLLFAGCAGQYPQSERMYYLDYYFGSSFQNAMCQQQLNPFAPNDSYPLTGLDARASENILQEYLKKPDQSADSIKNLGQ